MKKFNSGVMASLRRKTSLQQLEAQLKAGTKTEKGTRNVQTPLTDSNIKRINREILTLKSRI